MTLCEYEFKNGNYVCVVCGDKRSRSVKRVCRKSSGVITDRIIDAPHWLSCSHRGGRVTSIPGSLAGQGCSSSPVDVYQCDRFGEPVLKRCLAKRTEQVRQRVPGYTGRTCRECTSYSQEQDCEYAGTHLKTVRLPYLDAESHANTVDVFTCTRTNEIVTKNIGWKTSLKVRERYPAFNGRTCDLCRKGSEAMGFKIQWIRTTQLVENAKRLAWMLPEQISGVAGVPRSGMIVASIIATMRGVPMFEASRNHEPRRMENGFRILGRTDPLRGPLVIVEDSVNTGHSLNQFAHHAEISGDVLTACVYCNPAAQFKPKVFACSLLMPHYFEWHFFGSDLTRMAAFDFDGVICEACPPECDDDGLKYLEWMRTVKPLHLPYPHEVPLIVTARLEKYRAETEAWLAQHGVRVKQLKMGPWATKQRRMSEYNAGEYKGGAYEKAGQLSLFFEDCPHQARAIHQRSMKPVVCLTTGEVFE